jgi:hypothetical protein
MKRIKLFLVLTLSVLTALALMACASTELSGTVYFSLEDSPVEGAVITIDDLEMTSDTYGWFSAGSLPLRVFEGRVSLEGFPDHDFSVDLSEADIDHHFTIEIPATHAEITFIENTYDDSEVSPDDIKVSFNGLEVDSRLLTPGFQTGIIPPGDYLVVVESEIYYPFSELITLEQGEQEISLALDLTLEETYRRFNRANDLHRHTESYNYLHADIRSLLTVNEWASAHDTSVSIIDAAPSDQDEHEDWDSELTGNNYVAVISFERPFITLRGAERVAHEETQYWTNSDGRWYRIFPERFW